MKNKSAIIPFRKRKKGTEILLIKNVFGNKWVIPKGTIDAPLQALLSATKEAYEEAGVLGRPHPIMVGKYHKNNQMVPTYLLEVDVELKDYVEANKRERIWVKASDVANYVFEKDLLLILQNGINSIEKNGHYFYYAIKTFCKNENIQLISFDNKKAKIAFHVGNENFKRIVIRREKTNVEFSIDSQIVFSELKEIPRKINTNLLLENAVHDIGYWCIKQRKKSFSISRIHSVELKLLFEAYFINILKILTQKCIDFENDFRRGTYLN